MNMIKKGMLVGLTTIGMSLSAMASPINVGGVVWDPDSSLSLPSMPDFTSSGSIFETAVFAPGDTATGQGKVERLNSSVNNEAAFCPGCELTFSFSMDLVSFVGAPNAALGGVDGAFTFENLVIEFFVDDSQNYTGGADGTATDGDLWLKLVLNPSNFLTGTGIALGSGSDQGTGSAVLDVVDGLAMGNFDTNTKAAGSDLVLTSSFQPLVQGVLEGGFTLTGDTIPEPTTIALLGLGLLGFAARRKA